MTNPVNEKKNFWIEKIEENFRRYQIIVEKLKTIGILDDSGERIFQIRLNALDFPHGIGLRKIPFLKNLKPKKINTYIKNGKIRKKFESFEKWDLSTNQIFVKEVQAKLIVWERYLFFLEGNYKQTEILQEVQYTRILYFFRGLIWKHGQYSMIVGLKKFESEKEFKADYCSFFTALLTGGEVAKKAKSIKTVSQVQKIWYNDREQKNF